MPPRLFLCALSLAACSEHLESAGARDAGAISIFRLAAAQAYTLPVDAPDELLMVDDPYRRGGAVSLREGAVVGAWATAPGAAMVWSCEPVDEGGEDGDLAWRAR